jgi:hypothetical protein
VEGWALGAQLQHVGQRDDASPLGPARAQGLEGAEAMEIGLAL